MSYHDNIIRIVEEYRRLNPGEFTTRDAAAWAIRHGKLAPQHKEVVNLVASDIGAALRSQYFTDAEGRRVRRKHSITEQWVDEAGEKTQMTLWEDIETANPQFMQRSFSQRRRAVVNDCWQLKQDVDSYNQYFNNASPIQILFDFTDDMADREFSLSDTESVA